MATTGAQNSFFTTGDVATHRRVTPGAVRLWEKLGKLVPAATTTVGGFGLYAPKDVERVRREREERGA